MEIYIEYAVAENFILDATLLYLALKTVRLPIVKWRFFFAISCGTAFAVLFPLLGLRGFSAFAVRYAFGAIVCLVAVSSKSVKEHILTIAFFYLYTFALGGLLLGIYNFFDLEYTADGGYLLSRTPAGIVFLFAVAFAFVTVKLFSALYKKYSRKKLLYRCEITLNGIKAEGTGLLDTGNGLTYGGTPVCLLDKSFALAFQGELSRGGEALKTLFVHTATGGGELKIFQAKLKIYSENKENIIDSVYFALAPAALGKGYQIILHPQLFREKKGGKPC